MALARIAATALVALAATTSLSAHPHHRLLPSQETPTPPPGTIAPGAKGVSGQGALRFRVVLTAAQLPEEARKVVVAALGVFAVDHRPVQEQSFFSLPVAGSLLMWPYLMQVYVVSSP